MLAYIRTSNLQSIYRKPHKLHVHNWELHACMNVSSCNLCLIFGMQNVYACSSFIVLCACIICTYVLTALLEYNIVTENTQQLSMHTWLHLKDHF